MNILAKDTTKLDSPFTIAFLAIVFSTAQRTVALITNKSPKDGLDQNSEGFICARYIRKVPTNITAKAKICFLVIFSFKNKNAKIIM